MNFERFRYGMMNVDEIYLNLVPYLFKISNCKNMVNKVIMGL
jgi:hypothetical protein